MSLTAHGQPERRAATLDDVVNELRALRADLNQSSSIGVRGQLLTARLTLQEQRIHALGQELVGVQARLDAATKERGDMELRSRQMAAALDVFSGGRRNADPQPPPEAIKQFEAERAQVEAQLADMQAREQRIRAEATEISNLIAAEQGRWSDFNSRLDDLERSLPAGR
jgi:hypothetical protein